MNYKKNGQHRWVSTCPEKSWVGVLSLVFVLIATAFKNLHLPAFLDRRLLFLCGVVVITRNRAVFGAIGGYTSGAQRLPRAESICRSIVQDPPGTPYAKSQSLKLIWDNSNNKKKNRKGVAPQTFLEMTCLQEQSPGRNGSTRPGSVELANWNQPNEKEKKKSGREWSVWPGVIINIGKLYGGNEIRGIMLNGEENSGSIYRVAFNCCPHRSRWRYDPRNIWRPAKLWMLVNVHYNFRNKGKQ